jgi:transglutaminase-like putative cysteine protease
MVRGLDTWLALFAMSLGLLLGWAFARSPLPGWLAGILAFGIGIAAILVRVGQLGGKMANVLLALAQFAGQALEWPRRWPDVEPVAQACAQLWDAIATLIRRWLDWQSAVTGGIPAYDPVAVALVWSFAIWLIAAWACWSTFRRSQPLAGMLPALGLLATMLAYTNTGPHILLLPVTATLLLIVLVSYALREHEWQYRGVDAAEDLRADLAVVVVPLTLVLALTAALTPSWSARDILQFTHRLIEVPVGEANRLPDSFGVIPAPAATTVFDAVRAPGLPRQHLIGAGQELSKQVVMTIQTGEARAMPHYWRSTTYDRYIGRGWLTSSTEITDYHAGQSAAQDLPAHYVLRQQVQAYENLGGLLFATGIVVSADRDYRIAWRSPGDAFSASIQTQVYQVDSLVPAVGEVELRAAASDYPAWVRERYLAPLDDVPERVLALARDLTATARTPYDRARAIESFLREYPYTLDVPAPPPGRDVVDYFLFDLKRGYCDYYASAMVVLARAAGLPARLVVGYAPGDYDEENARYVVTEASAHSWVDIYFPPYGWIEFEPTGGRAPIDRSEESQPPESKWRSVEPSRRDGSLWDGINGMNWTTLLGISIALCALAGFAFFAVDGWRLYRLPPKETIGVAYGRMTGLARGLGVRLCPADTPNETAARMAGRFATLARGRWGRTVARVWKDVDALTALYIQSCYSPRAPQTSDRLLAIRLWQRLHFRLRLLGLWQRARRVARGISGR